VTNPCLNHAEEPEKYSLVTVYNFKRSYNSIISALACRFKDMEERLHRHLSTEFFMFLTSTIMV